MIHAKGNRSTLRKTPPSATSCTVNHIWTGLGFNSSLRGDRFFQKCLRYAIAANFQAIFRNLFN
jgi:hypothetical protein